MIAHKIETSFLGSAEQLEKNWTVQRQTSYGFSSIACDQVIEQTANRDAKTAGGIIGNTLNRGAVHRWLLSQSERTAIARQCQVMAGSSHQTRYEITVVKETPEGTQHVEGTGMCRPNEWICSQNSLSKDPLYMGGLAEIGKSR